jgi:Neprosin
MSDDEAARHLEERLKRRTVVKTTTLPSGQVIDWIPVESQAGYRSATPPPSRPRARATPSRPPSNTQPASFELHDPSLDRGPPGTVPVVRKDPSRLPHSLKPGALLGTKGRYSADHGRRLRGDPAGINLLQYFHATANQYATSYGCSTTLNVWQPYVQHYGDHSIMQTWVQNYDAGNLQSIEVGWGVDPERHFFNSAPFLFIFYTTNDYGEDGTTANIGGYDQDVDGWVQVDTTIFPGAQIATVSAFGGPSYGVDIQVELWEGNWWISVLERG